MIKQTQINFSYPLADYHTFAKIINDKTKYGIGDAYPIIKEVLFLMKNDKDVVALVNSFGTQQAYLYAQPVGKPENLFQRLRFVLKDDLFKYNSKEIVEINNDWLKKKISYKI